MTTVFKSATATTVMALKILLVLLFQNKPLILFWLTCHSFLIRLQVIVTVLFFYPGVGRR
ncbi:hypothetical protein ACFPMF_12710 [Larkinella bovis]|uniref:Uncharacterized protein n=1 Tax=Larkinella bovis TaxID=683041 RepID=A0ABW0ICB6_9BACT